MYYKKNLNTNKCIKKKIFFKLFNSCKIQLVEWWWINSYSHNTNKPQSMPTSMISYDLWHYMIT
jgi:hypothetical protein